MSHDQPSYANLPGIRVFGMKCVAPSASGAAVPQRKKPQPHRVPPKQPSQSSYHYLHRPDSIVHASELPQHIQHHGSGSLGSLTNGYGRSAGEKGEGAEETAEANETTTGAAVETTTFMVEDQVREKKSMPFDNDQNGASDVKQPEFPWHKVMELQDALRWNANN